jgi:hypothetical protein
MLQKETLSPKKKRDLLQISDVFDLFDREVRVKDIIEQTGFSRKKVWKLLGIIQFKKGVEKIKNGVYKPISPRFNELRRQWGGEEKRFTINEFIGKLKKSEIRRLKEQNMENPAILELTELFPIDPAQPFNSRAEQERIDSIKNRAYDAFKYCKNPRNFKVRILYGCLFWEKQEKGNGD